MGTAAPSVRQNEADFAPPEIEKRNLKFVVEPEGLRDWHPEGPHVSHFFNVLSIFFPEGESFFIDAVRQYGHRIRSPRLASDVRGFTGQEAMHSREHRRYNRALREAGLPVDRLERVVDRVLDVSRRYTPRLHQLAATIALEHVTAIMAHSVLSEERVLEGADPTMARLWRWHAIEETEHKSVAFDVFREVAGAGPRTYFLRTGTFVVSTVMFVALVVAFHLDFRRAEGRLLDVRGWGRFFRWLWIRPGWVPGVVADWFRYFRPGFHPWDHDNRYHVERWKREYEAEGAVPA